MRDEARRARARSSSFQIRIAICYVVSDFTPEAVVSTGHVVDFPRAFSLVASTPTSKRALSLLTSVARRHADCCTCEKGLTMVFNGLKERIHNFRIPIKNPRTLFMVQCVYFITPVILGCTLMQYIVPSPDDVKKRLTPSDGALAVTDVQRRGLQETLAAAEVATASARAPR